MKQTSLKNKAKYKIQVEKHTYKLSDLRYSIQGKYLQTGTIYSTVWMYSNCENAEAERETGLICHCDQTPMCCRRRGRGRGMGDWGGGSVGALHLQASSVHASLEELDDFTIPSRFLHKVHAPTHTQACIYDTSQPASHVGKVISLSHRVGWLHLCLSPMFWSLNTFCFLS